MAAFSRDARHGPMNMAGHVFQLMFRDHRADAAFQPRHDAAIRNDLDADELQLPARRVIVRLAPEGSVDVFDNDEIELPRLGGAHHRLEARSRDN
ncbi:MAG TPA: hypothetical protein VGH62_09895 [Bradyrhizobium sp.]